MARNVKLYSGYYYSYKNSDTVFYESSYEYKAIRMMEANPLIIKYSRCELCLSVEARNLNGSPRRFNYNPDFFVTYENGRECIIEVKAYGLLGDFFVKSKLSAAQEMVKYLDIEFFVWSESDLGSRPTKGGKNELMKYYFTETGQTKEK